MVSLAPAKDILYTCNLNNFNFFVSMIGKFYYVFLDYRRFL